MPNILIGFENGSNSTSWTASRTGIQKNTTITYIVVAENENTNEEEIRNLTPGLPILYFAYGTGILVTCIGINAEQSYVTKHPVTDVRTWVWKVECEFSNDSLQGDASNDPLTIPPVIRYNGSVISAQSNRDADGNHITDFFGEPLNFTATYPVGNLSVARFEPLNGPDIITEILNKRLPFEGTCNATSFHGAPPGTCLMQAIASAPETRGGIIYDYATYNIQVLVDLSSPTAENTWVTEFIPHITRLFSWRDEARTRDFDGKTGGFSTRIADGQLIDPETEETEFVEVAAKRRVDWGPLLI